MPYYLVVSRHPIDSVLLSLELGRSDRPLLVAPCADAATNNFFNLEGAPTLDSSFSGGSQPTTLDYGGRTFELFMGCETGSAGLLERLRDKYQDQNEILVALTYDRLEGDLPLLKSNDKVSLFWSTEEMLTDRYLECVEYLEERLEAEQPGFSGLHFYHRGKNDPGDRWEQIINKAQLETDPSKAVEGGYQWSKACS